jgi:hypothetical protein
VTAAVCSSGLTGVALILTTQGLLDRERQRATAAEIRAAEAERETKAFREQELERIFRDNKRSLSDSDRARWQVADRYALLNELADTLDELSGREGVPKARRMAARDRIAALRHEAAVLNLQMGGRLSTPSK